MRICNCLLHEVRISSLGSLKKGFKIISLVKGYENEVNYSMIKQQKRRLTRAYLLGLETLNVTILRLPNFTYLHGIRTAQRKATLRLWRKICKQEECCTSMTDLTGWDYDRGLLVSRSYKWQRFSRWRWCISNGSCDRVMHACPVMPTRTPRRERTQQ